MISGRKNGSILDILLKSSRESSSREYDRSEFEKSNDIDKYFTYSYHNFNLNSGESTNISKNSYLLVIKNNYTLNFHTVHSYVSETDDPEEVTLVSENRRDDHEDAYVVGDETVGMDFKENSLKLKRLTISSRPNKRINKRDLMLIIECPVKWKSYHFTFCACLEHGNKITIFSYDPTELEYVGENETITLDNITIRDIFPGIKSFYSDEPLINFTQIYNFLMVTLKKFKFRLKGFDEVENLFDLTLLNYRRINSIDEVVTYEGLCINKCYLDEKIFESFSSFSYLDDSLIDFFNQFTTKYIMDSLQKETWVIMSTHFLRKIRQYEDSREAYRNTWKWTKKFKRALPLSHFIFIPINLSQVHWSLVIIAYPKYALRRHSIKMEKKASIIHLDSLGHHQLEDEICDLLKNYLYQEYEHRCKSVKETGFRFIVDSSCWDYITPTRGVPFQNNGYDCGIFLIEYIIYLVLNQNIFSQLIPKYYSGYGRGELVRSPRWFSQIQIQQRRLNMKEVLRFMRDNPKWSSDDDKIKYIKDKMTEQY